MDESIAYVDPYGIFGEIPLIIGYSMGITPSARSALLGEGIVQSATTLNCLYVIMTLKWH